MGNPLDTSVFAADYASARASFLSAATLHKQTPESFIHPLSVTGKITLATDTLWLGNSDAETVLVLLVHALNQSSIQWHTSFMKNSGVLLKKIASPLSLVVRVA